MDNPIKFNISDRDFYIWVSKFGVKYMKYFDTPEHVVNFIKNNPHKCLYIDKKQTSILPYKEWVKNAKQEQEKWLNKNNSHANNKTTYSKQTQNTQQKTVNSNTKINKDKIITCPSCEQKIKIKLPLPSNIGKCIKCLSRFKLVIDSNDSLYITLIENQTNSGKKTDTIKTVDDCFTILEISCDTDKKDIKTAYKKKMIEYHPDKTIKLGKKLQKLALKEAKNINIAYSMLKEKGYI
jgi:DnaJ-class molecular chaperone